MCACFNHVCLLLFLLQRRGCAWYPLMLDFPGRSIFRVSFSSCIFLLLNLCDCFSFLLLEFYQFSFSCQCSNKALLRGLYREKQMGGACYLKCLSKVLYLAGSFVYRSTQSLWHIHLAYLKLALKMNVCLSVFFPIFPFLCFYYHKKASIFFLMLYCFVVLKVL